LDFQLDDLSLLTIVISYALLFLVDFLFLCRILLAFSNSRLRVIDKLLPARLMKYWIMRMPEPMPRGLTLFLAIVLAIVCASFLNKSFGGEVETVFTLRTHFLV
jgi:hypothetical protein